MVKQLLNLAQFFDTPLPDPEQVTEVPKILSDDVPMRAPVREPQLVEQLVEVPTIVTWSLLQLIMKQNVDVPVPGRGGRISGLQGFLPGQSSTALPPEERISERIVEQIVDFSVGGGLQDFRPGQSSSASSSSPAGVHGSADGSVSSGFSHFSPKEKSPTLGPRSESELSADFTPSTLRAQQQSTSPAMERETWVNGDDVWVRVDTLQGPVLEIATVRPLAMAPAVVRALTAAPIIGRSVWWSPGFGVPLGCGCFRAAAWEIELGPIVTSVCGGSQKFVLPGCRLRGSHLESGTLFPLRFVLTVTFPV